MRPILILLVACLLVLPSCVQPILSDGGVGLEVSPLASLKRVRQGEASTNKLLDTLTDGQQELATALGKSEVALRAKQAILEKKVSDAAMSAEDSLAIDWTTVILGALGVGGLGAGGMAYRKKLLRTPPPAG